MICKAKDLWGCAVAAFRPARAPRRRTALPALETLEDRTTPAITAAGVRDALAAGLADLKAAQSALMASVYASLPDGGGEQALRAVSPGLLNNVATDLGHAADKVRHTAVGATPALGAGFTVTYFSGTAPDASGRLAVIHYQRDAHTSGRASLAGTLTADGVLDNHGGLSGSLSAAATRVFASYDLEVRAVNDQPVAVVTPASTALGVDGLSGKGTLTASHVVLGALPDLSVSAQVTVAGGAAIRLHLASGEANLRPHDLLAHAGRYLTVDAHLQDTVAARVTSKELTTAGINWGVNTTAALSGVKLTRQTPHYDLPAAVDVLKTVLKNLPRVSVPSDLAAAFNNLLNVKVPFTGKTLGQLIDLRSKIPLVINTVNYNSYTTWARLVAAVQSDSRFHVLMSESDVGRLVKGTAVRIVSVSVKPPALGTSFNLAETPLVDWGIGIASLKASLYLDANLSAGGAATVVVTSSGPALQAGTQLKLDASLEGGIKGSLKILGYKAAEASGGATLGAHLTVTLAGTNGLWYLGEGSRYNPAGRSLVDYLQVDRSITAGITLKGKINLPWPLPDIKKSWSKDWTLAKDTTPAKYQLK
jgi:hypothetical protein